MSKKRKKRKKYRQHIRAANLLHEHVVLKLGTWEGKRGVVIEYAPDENRERPYKIKVRGENRWIDNIACGVYVYAAINEFTVI